LKKDKIFVLLYFIGIKMKKVKYILNEVGERPWGMWKCISVGDKYISKIITVNPHSSLSLQLHNFRKEHWVVIKGNPVVTLGNIKKEYSFGQSIDIPVKTKHRLENLTDDFVEILEIQIGDVLDENDIIRFEDIYNRI
jgi:mannose-6-phosphate isomerase-like protein (cupin superfamily)